MPGVTSYAELEAYMRNMGPAMDSVWDGTYRAFDSKIPLLFDVRTTGNALEKRGSVHFPGSMKPFEGTRSYDKFEAGYDKSVEFDQFSGGYQITRKTIEDQDTQGILDNAAQMGRQAARSRELWASLVFRFANATTFNFKGKTVTNSCMDALSLCSASHPISRADSTTISNYTTNAFSADNLKSAVAAMRAFKDPNGDPAMVRPDVLLIAPSIEQTVAQVINSTQIPGQANNDTNILNPSVAGTIWQGGLQVVVWDWLEPSSGSAPWFVIDRQVFRQNCRWYDRVPVRLERNEDFNSLTISVSNYGRWNHMLYDWRGIYGNFPA